MELINKSTIMHDAEKGASETISQVVRIAYLAGAAEADANPIKLWKPAEGSDLPIFDREVIVLTQPYPLEGSEFAVSFAHRPNPNGWDGRNIITDEVNHYTPQTYDKGGWNIPNVKWWLDIELPNMEEEQ